MQRRNNGDREISRCRMVEGDVIRRPKKEVGKGDGRDRSQAEKRTGKYDRRALCKGPAQIDIKKAENMLGVSVFKPALYRWPLSEFSWMTCPQAA